MGGYISDRVVNTHNDDKQTISMRLQGGFPAEEIKTEGLDL